MPNVDLIKAANDAFGAGKIEEVLGLLDKQVTWKVPPSLPYGGVYEGREDVAAFFALLPKYYDQIELRQELLLEGADLVTELGTMAGVTTIGGEDAAFEVRYCLVWRIRRGKVIEMEEFSDTAGLLRAIGGAAGE